MGTHRLDYKLHFTIKDIRIEVDGILREKRAFCLCHTGKFILHCTHTSEICAVMSRCSNQVNYDQIELTKSPIKIGRLKFIKRSNSPSQLRSFYPLWHSIEQQFKCSV